MLWELGNPQTPETGWYKLTGWPLDSCVSPWCPVPHAPGWSSGTSSLPQFPLPDQRGHPLPGRFVPGTAGEAGAGPVPAARAAASAAGSAGSEGRQEKRLLPHPGMCVAGVPGDAASDTAGPGGSWGCGTASVTLLSASEESRCPLPLLRAAQRTLDWLSEPTELQSSAVAVTSARSRVKAPPRVALHSVRVASPGLSPAGCRALAPPAEEREAVPAATGASCRNFLCRRGMAAARPCANLSVGDKCHGKWSWDGHHAVLCAASAVPLTPPSPSC